MFVKNNFLKNICMKNTKVLPILTLFESAAPVKSIISEEIKHECSSLL